MRSFLRVFTLFSTVLLWSINSATAQSTFYFEDFEAVPCASYCNANAYPGWTVTQPGFNGGTPNQWFVSCAENGQPVGGCGSGCVGAGDNTLHVASTLSQPLALIFCPTGDCGAAYFAGMGSGSTTTNIRAESPTIDLSTGACLELKFNYIENGDSIWDNFRVDYYDGITWATLADPFKTPLCGAQGQWMAFTVSLPASAEGNPNVKIGFRWVNNDDLVGTDPSAAIDSVRIIGEPFPNASFTMTSPLCTNAVLSLSLNNPDSTATYVVDVQGIQFDPALLPVITFPDTVTFAVCMVGTNTCAVDTVCQTLFVVDCSNGPIVDFSYSPTGVLCEGDSVFYQANCDSCASLMWNFPGGSPATSTAQNPVVVYNTAGQYSVTLTGTDSSGGSTINTQVDIITVNNCSAPVSSFTISDDTICTNDCVTFVNNSTAAAGATYEWYFQNGTPASSPFANPGSVCYNAIGVNSVLLVVIDVNGVDSSVQYITVQDCPVPVSDFTASSTTVCEDSSITFTDQSSNATSWAWTFTGGTPASFNGQYPPAIVYSTAGSYTATLTVANAAGLDSTYSISITVDDCGIPPTASFTPIDTVVCIGSSVTFVNTSIVGTNPTYAWGFQGGNPLFSLVANPPAVTYNVAGVYTVALIVNDDGGADTIIQTITVVDCPVPIALFTASTTNPCKFDTVVFTDQSQYATQWSWTFDTGSPATYNGQNPPPIVFNTSGNQTITLVVSDSTGTDSTYTMIIDVLACGMPTAAFASSDSSICPGSCIQFFDLTDTAIGWLWSFPGGNPSSSSQQNPPYICYDQPGTYPVQLVAFNSLGIDTAYIQSFITVYPPPTAYVNVDSLSIIQGQSVELDGDGGVSYHWYPAEGLNIDSFQHVTATPGLSTTYTLVVTDANGCTASEDAIITVFPPNWVFVPNLFSPNDDKVNDKLFLRTSGTIDRMEFSVYDRWGTMLYYSNDVFDGWDGTFQGKAMNTGVYVYYYRVRFADGVWLRGKGDVTLIR